MPAVTPLDFCLLIPCYNNLAGLIESLNSVLYPSGNYFVLIVDDGSAEPVTTGAIKSQAAITHPLHVLSMERNSGITIALNNGLSWIETNLNTKYIARLDCGDICHPDRFTTQVNYLDKHPDIALLGAWCLFKEKKTGKSYTYTTPENHDEIVKAMYFRNVFIHPSVFLRAVVLKQTGFYPDKFDYAEDYALFWKIILKNNSHIIQQFLITCEINYNGLSNSNRGKQLQARWRVIKTFAPDKTLKLLALFRLGLMFAIPNAVVLWFKKFKG